MIWGDVDRERRLKALLVAFVLVAGAVGLMFAAAAALELDDADLVGDRRVVDRVVCREQEGGAPGSSRTRGRIHGKAPWPPTPAAPSTRTPSPAPTGSSR